MNKLINTRIKHKYDTSINWSTENPILLSGEIGIDSDTSRIKVGDGTSTWNVLPYLDEVISSVRIMHNEESLFNILTNYLLNIDYDTLLAFDTSEIVIGSMPTPTIAVLGQAMLGYMVLA